MGPGVFMWRPYLQQAEHGVAHIEAVPPVVVRDAAVTLPHCVHPLGQRLGKRIFALLGFLLIHIDLFAAL